MATWSRRLSSAQNKGNLGKPAAPKKPGSDGDITLPDSLPSDLSEDDRAAVKALLTIASERPGFRTRVTVQTSSGGAVEELEIEIAHDDAGPTIRPLSAHAVSAATVAMSEAPALDDDDDGSIIEWLTDTLVVTSDIVGIFATVGAEALWANDAFATAIPVREADKIWLIELLDEWSKGHYEVNVLPALVQYGRWSGRLTLEPSGRDPLPVSASLVAHRDRTGEIEAVSLVARDLREIQEAESRVGASETRLAALVEHAADIIAVVDAVGAVLYASPATTRNLGLGEGALDGTSIIDRVHEEDRDKCDFQAMARPDDSGIPPTAELRLAHEDGQWRHFEVVATDLSDNPAIGGVVLNARDVTERVEQVARLADRAYTDPLTLLPNRMRVLDRLGHALQNAGADWVVAMLVDVDRFKAFNDGFGHAAGDELLRQVAHRLSDEVGENDTLGRLGGNEFAIVMRDVPDVDDAIVAGQKIRAALAEPFKIGAQSTEVTVSVGVAVAIAGQGPEDLLSDADSAVGIAKDAGGNRVEVLTAELRNTVARRAKTEELLRRALDEADGVQVHYQPIIDLDTRKITGAEALLRVHDDEGALLTPAAFLEAAEHTGLITPLGGQVLQRTCRQLAEWNEEIGPNNPAEISVNVSPRQLADPAFADIVKEAIEASGVDPGRLCLEITESLLIGQFPNIDESVAAVRDIGVKMGLDDFGAGQSSLGYLKRFPLDFVKIDKGLIAGLGQDDGDTAIVRATVELGHSLGLVVIAVGVETQEQLEFLELLGCDRAQGFYFAKAVPPSDFAARVRAEL